jgi:hypothetical protein
MKIQLNAAARLTEVTAAEHSDTEIKQLQNKIATTKQLISMGRGGVAARDGLQKLQEKMKKMREDNRKAKKTK